MSFAISARANLTRNVSEPRGNWMSALRALWEQYRTGRNEHHTTLWNLFVFQFCLEHRHEIGGTGKAAWLVVDEHPV